MNSASAERWVMEMSGLNDISGGRGLISPALEGELSNLSAYPSFNTLLIRGKEGQLNWPSAPVPTYRLQTLSLCNLTTTTSQNVY